MNNLLNVVFHRIDKFGKKQTNIHATPSTMPVKILQNTAISNLLLFTEAG